MEEIKNKSENIDIPESLSVNNMMNKIKDNTKTNRKRLWYKQIVVVAICLCIFVLGIGLSPRQLNKGSGSIDEPSKVLSNKKQTYDDIYKQLKKLEKDNEENYGRSTTDTSSEVAKDTAMESAAPLEKGDYSGTNVQVQGVDEADIIKTDGRYIYILESQDEWVNNADSDIGFIRIVDTKDEMKEVSKIVIKDRANTDNTIEEMYVNANKLIVIYTSWQSESDKDLITVVTYDISDKTNVKVSGTVTQVGAYSTSRLVGDILYVITNYYIADLRVKNCVPVVNGCRIPADNVILFDECNSTAYSTIISIDTREPSKVLDSKAILSGYGEVYVSEQNIYIIKAATVNIQKSRNTYIDTSVTDIIRVEYKDGKLEYKGLARVNGYVNDVFSMDEYNGNLRIVTTTREYAYRSRWWGENEFVDDTIDGLENADTNNLYIINMDMMVVGKIEGLAKNESIQSARFMGDTGYFVTFRQVDPLFAVDLSNPTNPKILSELKITGFSSYLHFWDENLLLGIGQEVDPKTNSVLGLKLSMFDISDPRDVTEINKKIIKGDFYADALSDHKAVLIDKNKNMIGFSICDYNSNNDTKKYYVFSYDKIKGFGEELTHQFRDLNRENYYDVEDYYDCDDYFNNVSERGLYIGEYLYIVQQKTGISQYAIDNYKLVKTLDF